MNKWMIWGYPDFLETPKWLVYWGEAKPIDPFSPFKHPSGTTSKFQGHLDRLLPIKGQGGTCTPTWMSQEVDGSMVRTDQWVSYFTYL